MAFIGVLARVDIGSKQSTDWLSLSVSTRLAWSKMDKSES